MAYVVTRPLGASFSDYISKPASMTGLGFGNGQTAVVITFAVLVLVSYLAIARPDTQRFIETGRRRSRSANPDYLTAGLEVDVE